jgi:uncharacterized protein YndB with AHSA1/START domain
MTAQSYTTTITVEQDPEVVFDAVNHPDEWWSESIEGRGDHVGAEFVFDTPDQHYWKFRVTELDRPRRVVWRVLEDSRTEFVHDVTEWNGTEVRFDITEDAGQTQVRFTHSGLVPEFECYEACSTGWAQYIRRSLHDYITAGRGQPGAY